MQVPVLRHTSIAYMRFGSPNLAPTFNKRTCHRGIRRGCCPRANKPQGLRSRLRIRQLEATQHHQPLHSCTVVVVVSFDQSDARRARWWEDDLISIRFTMIWAVSCWHMTLASIVSGNINTHLAGPILAPILRPHTVGHRPLAMSSFSLITLGLLEDLKHSPLKLLLNAQDHATFSIGIVLGLIVLYATRYFTSPYRRLPPGPRGYPIIGNLLDLRSGQWLKFAEWQKEYGKLPLSALSRLIFNRTGLDQVTSSTSTQPVSQ
jgi:hypothetical protein